MNRLDYLLAFGSFSAGIAIGLYFGGGNDEHSGISAKKLTLHHGALLAKKCQVTSIDKAKEMADIEEDIAEVLFFPDPGYACNDFLFSPEGCQNEACQFLHKTTSLGKMCHYLRNAKKSIDVCIYTLSNSQLVSGLMHSLDRGVQVRIIIDHTMAASASKQLNKLSPKGALIFEAASNYLMHNKFVVIDQRIGLTGSFNWTLQGSHGNYENVAIFSHKKLVQQYAAKFAELWKEFADLNVPSHPAANASDRSAFNPLQESAWGGIIVGYEPPVNNYNSPGNRRQDSRSRRF